MKQTLKIIGIIVTCVYVALVLLSTKVVWTEPAVVLEKIATQNRDGHITNYVLILKYQDGFIEEKVVRISTYANCKIGDIYYFNRDSTNWSNIDFMPIKLD